MARSEFLEQAGPSAVSACQLCKRYGHVTALDRVDIDLVSDGFRFIGGLHNLLWKGEPYRFRIETLEGAPVGDSILRLAPAAPAEAPAAEQAAP